MGSIKVRRLFQPWYLQAIAKILYEDTPPEELKTLAGIEQAVRSQMQRHVMPQVGVF